MAKLSLNKPTSGFNLAQINENFTRLEQELQDKVLYRDNPPGEPNTIKGDLDLNSKNLLNVGSINGVPASDLADLAAATASATASATAAAASALDASASAISASASAVNASSSSLSASTSAATASIYASIGLGGAAAFDLGSVTDLIVIFPTDWGTLV